MRFGIMTMQKDLLIPSTLDPAQAMAYLASFDHAEVVRQLAEHGFKLVELSGDMILFFPQAFAPATVERLAALKREYRLDYTVHVPLWSLEPSTPLQPVREGSVYAAAEVIRATLPLQPDVYVFHATGELAAEFYRMDLPEGARDLLMRLFQQQAGQSIKTILEGTGLPSRKLAIETVEFPFNLTMELAERFDLSLCLDTGHILAGFSGSIGLFQALERCRPRLAEVHLHDCPLPPLGEIAYGQDHRPLGTGDLDLAGLLDYLVEADFGGPVILELTVEETLASLQKIQAIRPRVMR